jgi:hypothetical protein
VARGSCLNCEWRKLAHRPSELHAFERLAKALRGVDPIIAWARSSARVGGDTTLVRPRRNPRMTLAASLSLAVDQAKSVMKQDSKTKKPFFARYLEAQELEQATGGAKPTAKYPSDGDEYQTMKYPSDGDEGGVDI